MIADRFVAAPDNWPRATGASVRAIVVHMAEGGGTVSWLTRDDGNSSHYVIEYTGRITQMVFESRAAGSINPKLLRTSNDASFTFLSESIVYGVRAAKAALGTGWSNPNSYVIAIEIEGFAAEGPNATQSARLKALVADIRKRHPGIPVLGHRDFQSYKACPGKRIRWADLGGHGVKIAPPVPTTPEEPVGLHLTFPPGPIVSGTVGLPKGVVATRVADKASYPVPDDAKRAGVLVNLMAATPVPGYQVDLNGDEAHFVPKDKVLFTETVVDCKPVVDAAVAATKASARVTFG